MNPHGGGVPPRLEGRVSPPAEASRVWALGSRLCPVATRIAPLGRSGHRAPARLPWHLGSGPWALSYGHSKCTSGPLWVPLGTAPQPARCQVWPLVSVMWSHELHLWAALGASGLVECAPCASCGCRAAACGVHQMCRPQLILQCRLYKNVHRLAKWRVA